MVDVDAEWEWAHAVVSVVCAIGAAISVTRMVSRNLVFAVRTHVFLPLMAAAGFGVAIATGNGGAAVAMFLIARGTEFFTSAFRRTAKPGDLFGGGLLLGLAPLVHLSAACYVLLIPVAMVVFMRNLREAVLAMVGAALPAFVWWYVEWATGRGASLEYPRFVLPEWSVSQFIAAGMLVVCALVSLGSLMRDARRIRTRAYRIHIYMVFYLLIGVAGMRSAADLPMVAVPLGVVAAGWFSRHEGIVPRIVYVLTLLSVCVNL